MKAFENRNYKAAKFLKKASADPSIKDNVGRTVADYISTEDKENAAIINSFMNG